jgi:hypothetical protein
LSVFLSDEIFKKLPVCTQNNLDDF